MREVRLIDANALKDAHIECPDNISFFDFGEIVERFLQTVDEQPTVDAVPVCRCRDCKWCEYPAHNSTKYGCKLFDRCVKPDWFCADGKEKSDGRV